jgi:tripartite-type tricarboxylate transporter receptor subunit TctC
LPSKAYEIGAGMRRALAAPDVKDKLEALNMQVRGGSGEELRALLAADIAKWDRLVKERGIRIAQ